MSKFSLNLNDREWGEFSISQLFNVTIGKTIDGNKVDKNSGQYAYITRKETNNGLDGFIAEDINLLYKQYPTITIGNETAKPYVQMFPFFTGTKVNILSPRTIISKLSLFFIARSLEMHKEKYSYSFTINSTRLKKQVIQLPITENGEPDYAFMENFIKERMYHKLKQYNDYLDKQIAQFNFSGSLKDKQWGEFFITDIFPKIQRGKRLIRENQISGTIPYVSSSALNNGVDNFIQVNHSSMRQFENCISLANSGSVGSAFYEPFHFIASDHITHLKNEKFNGFIYLFIANICNRLSKKYNFNREINDKRIKREKIMLPITPNGEPDYAFMENYTRNLMLKKYKKYAQLRLQEYA